MYQKVWWMCKINVLPIKPIALMFPRLSPSCRRAVAWPTIFWCPAHLPSYFCLATGLKRHKTFYRQLYYLPSMLEWDIYFVILVGLDFCGAVTEGGIHWERTQVNQHNVKNCSFMDPTWQGIHFQVKVPWYQAELISVKVRQLYSEV